MKKCTLLASLVLLLFVEMNLTTVASGLQISQGISTSGRISYDSQGVSTSGSMRAPIIDLRIPKDTVYNQITDETIARELAMDYDMIQTWRGGFVHTMHEVNPDMIVLRYRAMAHISKGWEDYSIFEANGWLLEDVQGNLVYETDTPSNVAVDVGNVDYHIWLGNWIKDLMTTYGFDGMFADENSPFVPMDLGFNTRPVNPRTGNLYTDAEWVNDLASLIRTVKTISGGIVIPNVFGRGYIFWEYKNAADTFMEVSDGIMIENLFCEWQHRWISEEEWVTTANVLKYVTSKDKLVRAWSVIEQGLPTDATKEQFILFCYASMLLSIEDFTKTYISLQEEMENSHTQELLNKEIGVPVEDYHKLVGSSVYERDFTKIKVLVNPSIESHVVPLSEPYRTLDGQEVSYITMTPHTGVILLRTAL